MNWCLKRGGVKGTDSPGSQSFVYQNWGTEIWKNGGALPREARTGDIAIFRHQSDPGHGHVAFFKEISKSQPNTVEVLGGNQLKSVKGRVVHLIDYQSMRVDRELELFSIRTVSGLRIG